MKIIYNIAATYNSGGMERVLAMKSSWLAARKDARGVPIYEVIIVTTDQRGRKPFFPLASNIRTIDLGIDYEETNGSSFLVKLYHYYFKSRKHRRLLSNLLVNEKADVVVSMFCNEAEFLHKIKDGSKKVLEIHFSRFKKIQYGRKGIWALADKYRSANEAALASKYDAFITLTEEDRAFWPELNNIHVIPNARTFVMNSPANPNFHQVLSVGRFSYQKSFDRLIAAWALIASDFGRLKPEHYRESLKDWRLRIVGGGEMKKELLAQIYRLGLQDSVMLSAAENNVAEVYRKASIFTLASRYEGLPMVLLEAQAAGMPIVCFDCKCGPRDVVTDGVDGCLVMEGDIRELAIKLKALMMDADLRARMGKAAFNASERYEQNLVMEKWEKLFEGLL